MLNSSGGMAAALQMIDQLREQLKERGYLRHGIERWFALDPWRSRAFWLELATVALKTAILIAIFGALPHAAVTLFRNYPLSALETLGLIFDSAPTTPELITGLTLCVIFFLVATTVVSAAMLSFSIYELQRIPAIHQKS